MSQLATLQEKAKQIDKIADQFLSNGESVGIAKALATAQAMTDLRSLLDDQMMKPVMELMNSPLGFLTDKDPKRQIWKNGKYETPVPYPLPVVRDCAIEARLRGLEFVGNQFNIIGGRMYVTKEGFKNNLLKKVPGLTDLKIIPGVPKTVGETGALVEVKATWKMNGTDDGLSLTIPVRVNSQMGTDAILGKADRKMRCAIYGQITGSEITDGDVSEESMEQMKAAQATVVQPVAKPPISRTTPAPKPAAPPEEQKPEPTQESAPVASATTPAPAEPSEPGNEEPTSCSKIRQRLGETRYADKDLIDWLKERKFVTKEGVTALEEINAARTAWVLENWENVMAGLNKMYVGGEE